MILLAAQYLQAGTPEGSRSPFPPAVLPVAQGNTPHAHYTSLLKYQLNVTDGLQSSKYIFVRGNGPNLAQ